jgi:methyltransferase (TIGR00027 family)
MEEDRTSRTAEGTAIQRALHQTLDDDPKILNDPVAARLVDPSSDFYKSFVEGLERMPAPFRLQRRGYVVMRSRYTEDCLGESVTCGIRQYMILGAGLDTFGYRQPLWAKSLRVFEVDHPATQRWKRAKLAAAKIQLPENVIFAPIDFERVTLKEGLAASGFDFGIPTFFSWLGVMSYLTEEASNRTLEFVLAMPRGSEIVLDFMVPNHLMPPDLAAIVSANVARIAEQGEPMLAWFVPEELAARLEAMGFSKVTHLSPQAARERYFAGRRDGLDTGVPIQIMRAVV